MKKLLVCLLLVFTTLMASAETRSYRIESFSCKTYVTGVWSTWSTPESSNLILSMNETNISINSSYSQFYTIRVDTYSTKVKSDGYTYDTWYAVDKNGLTLQITMISKSNVLYYVLIAYNDAKWLYGISK